MAGITKEQAERISAQWDEPASGEKGLAAKISEIDPENVVVVSSHQQGHNNYKQEYLVYSPKGEEK